MIELREMRHEEYPAYCDYFIDDYSSEIAKNYGHSMERSVELAKKIYIVASRMALKETSIRFFVLKLS